MATNRAKIRKGLAKAVAAIQTCLVELAKAYAIQALRGALEIYDDSESNNLTGNTRTGFTSAVYLGGKIIYGPINVLDGEAGLAVEPPTTGFVTVGTGGFKHYRSGAKVPAVKPYKNPDFFFRGTFIGAYASEKTKEWLRRHKPKGDGLAVVVANCSSYVTFLEAERDFDILVSESDRTFIERRFNSIVKSLDFEKMFKKVKV